jgi:murein DD-endopeptidase MepM/ murein hydrolase activator NlpD
MAYPYPYTAKDLTSDYMPPHRPEHKGKDFSKGKGTKIAPAKAGKVVAVNTGAVEGDHKAGGGYGNFVIIQHENGIQTLYAHLSKVNVKVGQYVTRDIIIGEEGNTGYSFGSHLHFEVRKNGVPINPAELLAESVDVSLSDFLVNKKMLIVVMLVVFFVWYDPFKFWRK